MPTIRIDEDVWRFLQSKAKPFEDSPNDVLRRELHISPIKEIGSKVQPHTNGRRNMLRADRDYTGHRPRGYWLDASHTPVMSFKEILLKLSNALQANHRGAFDKIALGLGGSKRAYYSQNAADLKFAEQLRGSDLFVETNLNANLIVGICRTLAQELGHKFRID